MLPHPLTANFQEQKYQNEPKFIREIIYSRNNSHNMKEGAYVINLDEYKSTETN